MICWTCQHKCHGDKVCDRNISKIGEPYPCGCEKCHCTMHDPDKWKNVEPTQGPGYTG